MECFNLIAPGLLGKRRRKTLGTLEKYLKETRKAHLSLKSKRSNKIIWNLSPVSKRITRIFKNKETGEC